MVVEVVVVVVVVVAAAAEAGKYTRALHAHHKIFATILYLPCSWGRFPS